MIGRPDWNGTRVSRPDDARYQGGTRASPIYGCVWHCTAGDTVAGARGWMDRLEKLPDGRRVPLPPKKRASYHYLIGKDGMIVRTVHPRMIANHAGNSSFPRHLPDTATLPRTMKSVNQYTIGVSFANDNGSDANPDDDDLTVEQVASGLWLGSVLQETWGYSPLRNWSHAEVSPGRKTDPLPRILDMSIWRGMLSLAEWPRGVDVTPERVVSICEEV